MEVADLRTVGDLLGRLGYEPREWKALHVLVDGSRRQPDASLDGARTVEILVAIGGG
jgi:sulfur carrier protein ThiS